MAQVKWTKAQQQAIEDRNETLLLSAAAGSGKTAVLTERAVRMMTDERDPVYADRLLMVTFSRAAAAEMKDRITKKLEEKLRETPESPLLLKQQLLMNQAKISTISSFCLDLVRQNFTVLDQTPDFQIADETLVNTLKKTGAETVLKQKMEEDTERYTELMEFLGVKRDYKGFLNSVLEIYNFLQSVPFPQSWMNEIAELYENTEEVADTIWGKQAIEETIEQLNYMVYSYEELLKTAENDSEVFACCQNVFESDINSLKNLRENVETCNMWDEIGLYVTGMKFATLRGLNKCENQELVKEIKDTRDKIKKPLKDNIKTPFFSKSNEYFSAQLQEIGKNIETLFDAVRALDNFMVEQMAFRNVRSFSDVEHLALKLLVQESENGFSPTNFAKKLSETIDHIFIDEYQDTNDLQDLIFRAISKDEENLFMVGDIKQSIYRFRQAKPDIFIKKKETFSSYDTKTYPAKIILGENFRSKKGVAGAINFVFERVMSKQVGEITYNHEERLIAQKDETEHDGAHLELFVVQENGEEDKAYTEAKEIAKQIQKMVQNRELIEKTVNGERKLAPCSYGDFVILLRSPKKTAHLYRQALQELKITSYTENGQDLFLNKEIMTLVDFLRVVDNPTLDVSVTSLLLSPLVGFTPDQVLQLRQKDVPLYVTLQESGQEQHKRFVKLIERYRQMAAVSPVYEVIDDFLRYTKFDSLAQVMRENTYRLGNIKLFCELAQKYSDTSTGTVSGFLHYIDRLLETDNIVPSAGLPVKGSDGVQIMSVHKSKGLEFPIVVLGGLYKQFNTMYIRNQVLVSEKYGPGIKKANPNYTLEKTLPYYSALNEHGSMFLSEEMRILYVAMTRAQEKLLVFTFGNDVQKALKTNSLESGEISPYEVKRKNTFAGWLLPALLQLAPTRELHLQYSGQVPKLQEAEFQFGVTICEKQGESLAQEVSESETAQADEDTVEKIKEKWGREYRFVTDTQIPNKMSVSALNAKKEEHTYKKRPKFLMKEGLSPTERGNAVHKFMQFANYNLAADNPEREIERMVELQFITPEEGRVIKPEKISKFFESEIGKLSLNQDNVFREYKLMSYIDPKDYFDLPQETSEKILVQGIADCIVNTQKGMIIVDYKTDFVKDPNELKERYSHQLTLYKAAIEESLQKTVYKTVLYSFSLDTVIEV